MSNAHFSWRPAACVSLYGLASWIVVNGLWVELPVLVNFLPEGWNLPAYLSILIQIANLGPLIYVLLTKVCRSKGNGYCATCFQPPERFANYVILAVGLLSCILMAHLWDLVLPLPGLSTGKHSVGLLSLALSAALVDCTSSVTFVAYLTGLPETYMGALTFGEAFSDIVPSSIALIQGVGGNPECINFTVNGTSKIEPHFAPPRFSVSVFMYVLTLILLMSLIAFIALDCMPWGLGKAVRQRYLTSMLIRESRSTARSALAVLAPQDDQRESRLKKHTPSSDVTVTAVVRDDFMAVPDGQGLRTIKEEDIGVSMPTNPASVLNLEISPWGRFSVPIFLLAYASLLTYGLLPAFQSYSTASYNTVTYHLAASLSGLFCALVAVIATYAVHRVKLSRQSTPRRRSLVKTNGRFSDPDEVSPSEMPCNTHRYYTTWFVLTVLFSAPAGYIIYLASTSPNPPHLKGFGPFLAVLSWILVRAGFGGLRTWLWLYLSSHSSEPIILRLAGLATQMGSAIGAVISFLLVVHFSLFHAKPPC